MAIEELLTTQPEAIISVRGKERFVVMDVAHYHYLRECELDAALAQSQADMAAGRYVQQSAEEHVARLDALVQALAAPTRKAGGKPVPKGSAPTVGKIGKKSAPKPARRAA